MLEWLSRWQTFFGKSDDTPPSTGAAPIALRQTWDLPVTPAPRWSLAEARALLECEQKKTICSISNGVREAPMQTVVLGCDPAANQLLLDEFFPRPASSPVGDRFQLRLPMGRGLMLLQVVVRDEINTAPTPAYVVEVVEKAIVSDRRQSQRLEFSSAAAPRADLLIPLSPRLRGHLLDISEDGFAMVFYGMAKPKLFSNSGDCRIEFDEHFVLRTKVHIQQLRARRKPFHHMIIRAHFVDLSGTEKDRVCAFIRDCLGQSARLSAA